MGVDVISSGSSAGNCVVVDNKYMFDCGCSSKKIREKVFMPDIKACFISHSHADHSKSVKYVSKFTKVFMTHSTLAELGLNYGMRNIYTLPRNWNYIDIDKGITAYYFYLDHDVVNVGYILYDNPAKTIVIYITDTASIPERFEIPIGLYDYKLYLICEANYTEEEIKNSDLPEKVVNRIKDTHLSFDNFKKFLIDFIANNKSRVHQTELHIIHISDRHSDINKIEAIKGIIIPDYNFNTFIY